MIVPPAVLPAHIYTARYPSTDLSVQLRLPLNQLHLHLDILKEPVLHIVQDRVVLNYSKVLSLTEELLVRVNTGAKHLLALLRTHLTHLLGHLVRG